MAGGYTRCWQAVSGEERIDACLVPVAMNDIYSPLLNEPSQFPDGPEIKPSSTAKIICLDPVFPTFFHNFQMWILQIFKNTDSRITDLTLREFH
jgi:hypothetical protein